jgi:predicted dehydrogenase
MPENAFAAVHVAYQLRFHPVVRRLKALLGSATPFAAHATVGQDLRQWRPGADYREGYSAVRAHGGGVLRDLSHELDYLTWILGPWSRLTALGGHVSGLDIDSDDVFSLLFATERCPVVTLNMNYLDSTLRRQVLALTDTGTVVADLAAGTVTIDGDTEAFAVDRDDPYVAMHEAAIAGDSDALCTADEGLAVVAMIAAAERAAAAREWAAA